MEVKQDKKLLDRLARLEGQIRGVRNMLESGRACEDVLTQMLAARSGLERCSTIMLERHLRDCVVTKDMVDEDQWTELQKALAMWSRHAPAS